MDQSHINASDAGHRASNAGWPERARIVKAAMDYSLATLALIVLSPVFLVIALAIRLESNGPVFFSQRRHGLNCREFVIYKFRTRTVMEDGGFIKQAEENDSRVTRVGRILRRSSLDEVPQLINVLRGEMSLVGPRPHALVHDEEFAKMVGWRYSWRHLVKPGITGWAQLHVRGEVKTREEVQLLIEHDLYYLENWSIWLDIEIMFRTVPAVLSQRRAF